MPGALRLTIAVVAVLLVTVVAGCLRPDATDLPDDEAKRVALMGMHDLAAALNDADAGNVRLFEMTVEAPMDMAGNGSSPAVLESRIEWGQGGVSRRSVTVEDDREAHQTTIWCTPSFVYYEWEGDVYQERAVGGTDRGGACSLDGIQQAEGLLEPFTPEGAKGLPLPEVHVEGREVTAVFEDPEDGRLVVQYDASGLVSAVHGEGELGSFDAYVTYGPRAVLVPPEATERLPARIETVRHYDEVLERDVYDVVASWHEPALKDIEARWIARDVGDGEAVVLLSFPLKDALVEPGGDADTFTFEDRDGDDRVTKGDRYTFDDPADGAEGLVLAEMVLYDLWADEEVNADVPGPAVGVTLIGVLVFLGLVRRAGA